MYFELGFRYGKRQQSEGKFINWTCIAFGCGWFIVTSWSTIARESGSVEFILGNKFPIDFNSLNWKELFHNWSASFVQPLNNINLITFQQWHILAVKNSQKFQIVFNFTSNTPPVFKKRKIVFELMSIECQLYNNLWNCFSCRLWVRMF